MARPTQPAIIHICVCMYVYNHRLERQCNTCRGNRQSLDRCIVRNQVSIPEDIAQHPHPAAVKVFAGALLERYLGMQAYRDGLKDRTMRVVGWDGVERVIDGGGRLVGYAHQGEESAANGAKLVNAYYTCGCCRCQGLAKLCCSDCCPKRCKIPRRILGNKTLEEWAREAVDAQCAV